MDVAPLRRAASTGSTWSRPSWLAAQLKPAITRVVGHLHEHRRDLEDAGAVDGEEDRAADASQELLELALQAPLVRGVAEAREDGAPADDLHFLGHEQLAHRSVGADRVLELHPFDPDAERGQQPHVLLVGAQHEIRIEGAPVAEEEEVGVVLEEGMAFPGGIGPDEADRAEAAEPHRAPAPAPDLLVLVEIVVLVQLERAEGAGRARSPGSAEAPARPGDRECWGPCSTCRLSVGRETAPSGLQRLKRALVQERQGLSDVVEDDALQHVRLPGPCRPCRSRRARSGP